MPRRARRACRAAPSHAPSAGSWGVSTRGIDAPIWPHRHVAREGMQPLDEVALVRDAHNVVPVAHLQVDQRRLDHVVRAGARRLRGGGRRAALHALADALRVCPVRRIPPLTQQRIETKNEQEAAHWLARRLGAQRCRIRQRGGGDARVQRAVLQRGEQLVGAQQETLGGPLVPRALQHR